MSSLFATKENGRWRASCYEGRDRGKLIGRCFLLIERQTPLREPMAVAFFVLTSEIVDSIEMAGVKFLNTITDRKQGQNGTPSNNG